MVSCRTALRLATLVATAAVGAILLPSAAAHARSFREGQIPNSIGCTTCHENTSTYVRNLFGQDVEASLEGTPLDTAMVQWTTVCDLDSDEDGEHNGAELGDPCCAWSDGASAPLDVTGAPGDPEVTSGNACEDGTPVAGAGGGGGMTPAGCPLLGGSGASLSFVALAALGLWRRRGLLAPPR